jgi:hypothetical protein
VKGGQGYWNLVRQHFPDEFNKMSELEQKLGNTCLRKNGDPLYLKDLDPSAGREQNIIMPDCGSFCDIEFEEFEHQNLSAVFNEGSVIRSYYKK